MSRVIDVREEPGRVAIVLRPLNLWRAVVFGIAQLAAMVTTVAVRAPLSQQDRVVAALVGLGSGLVLGSLLSWIAHLLLGRDEIITVAGTQLLIDHEVLRHPELRRRRAFEIDRIVNLRAVGKPANTLAFDHDGSPVQFGWGVAGSDADRVLQVLAAALPARASREADPQALAAVGRGPRAWSRLTLLLAALALACLLEIALAWPLERTNTTLAHAAALVTGGFVPAWAFLVWILEWRAFWQSPNWIGGVGAVYFLATCFAPPFTIMTWMAENLLSPFRAVSRDDLVNLFLVNLLLAISGLGWAVYRAHERGWLLSEVRDVSGPWNRR